MSGPPRLGRWTAEPVGGFGRSFHQNAGHPRRTSASRYDFFLFDNPERSVFGDISS